MNTMTKKRDVVLVVDDTPETLSMLNDTLDEAGMTVLVALEGHQAITIASSITPDIILMDAIMPNMDGFDTCKHIKANRDIAHIPVIFMTGLTDTESVVKGFEAGGIDYINKPVNGNELVARMRAHLTNARLTQSARTALDNAGQFLFAMNGSGKLQWATPQAHQLFANAGITPSWIIEILPQHLGQFFSPRFNKDKGIVLDSGNKPLEIRYISQSGSEEYLLQVIDLERPSDIELLRSALPLTERESEVLLWIARGKTNREIATIINMSPRTVNKHLEQVFKKLNVENRTGAAITALKYLEGV